MGEKRNADYFQLLWRKISRFASGTIFPKPSNFIMFLNSSAALFGQDTPSLLNLLATG